ncbi:hypothetical protein QJS66_14420 [Kocuria rhizophila]|nr:hypothetical protein QJS66_14420 [Kocuria rhizophila]
MTRRRQAPAPCISQQTPPRRSREPRWTTSGDLGPRGADRPADGDAALRTWTTPWP